MDEERIFKEEIGSAREAKMKLEKQVKTKLREVEALNEKPKFSSEDKQKFSSLQSEIEAMQTKIAEKEDFISNHFNQLSKITDDIRLSDGPINAGSRLGAGNNNRSPKESGAWVTKDGQSVAVKNKSENLAARPADVGLGELVKGMLTGKGRPAVKNALSEGTDSAGGFTVPTLTMENFVDKLRVKTAVIKAGAQSVSLDSDETILAKILSDPVAAWHAENAKIDESDMTFGSVNLKPRTLVSLVPASRELIMDSINVEEMIETAFTNALSTELDRAILFGDESAGEIKGLANYGGVSSTTIAEPDGGPLGNYDPLINLYRRLLDNNAAKPTAYLMAPREWETLAALKDANNRYMDRPQALDGIPFLDTNLMPTDETLGASENTSRIITGNFGDLLIGFRSEMRIELLTQTYAKNYQYGFLAHMRVDAVPLRAESFAQVSGITPA